jgi:stage V sporulation protein R
MLYLTLAPPKKVRAGGFSRRFFMDKEVKALEQAMEQIWDIATNKFGLDPYPTRFEIVPSSVMYEIGSYALPGRYSHWSFGKAYHKMKTMYDLGLSKIYEVVINSNPSYAFLLDTNSLLQNKLVIAHVLGHVDFFKHNAWFGPTNRRMLDDAQTHATRISEYEYKYGRKVVEEFLDSVLSIEEHIDPNFFIKKKVASTEVKKIIEHLDEYDDLLSLKERADVNTDHQKSHPETSDLPEKDLVWYILHNSPSLQPWQRDIMSMIHDEMLYFVPQMQTKIMNEGWACAVGNTLLVTENGLIRFDELFTANEKIKVASGDKHQLNFITEFHKEELVPTIKIRTRRGLEIEGAEKHRIQLSDGSWVYLRDIVVGQKINVALETDIWPQNKVKIDYTPQPASASLFDVAAVAGVSYSTAFRHFHGIKLSRSADVLNEALAKLEYQPGAQARILDRRAKIISSNELSEDLAWLLGYFVGDGNLTKSGIGFTTRDLELRDKLMESIRLNLGLSVFAKFDKSDGHERWRINIHAREIWAFLANLGIDLEAKARTKKIPSAILRSPKSVVAAFLQGYFDADAYAGKEGIRLSSSSTELIRTVQIVLLNFGILSTQRAQLHDNWHLEINGASCPRFLNEIGFSLQRKQAALEEFVHTHQWFKQEYLDEIVSIQQSQNDVYDISVDEKHAYVANGFINHNSIWHSRLMRELDLPTEEHLEFAELHSGVVSPQRGQLNPYYLGYKIYEDIERRWNNPTPEEIEKLGRLPNQGMAKLFEVREVDNDVSFLRNYLTEELVEELDLYVVELIDEEDWTITEKRWERVRDQLVANMTNFGYPYIEVADGDYNGNRELYLLHRHEGSDLDVRYARKVLEHVFKLWGRDVHLETKVEDEVTVLSYDGEVHSED